MTSKDNNRTAIKSFFAQQWKGILGLVLTLGLIIGGVFYLSTRAKQESSSPASTSASAYAARCYTIDKNIPFTTGEPRQDAILADVIKSNQDSSDLNAFLDKYMSTHTLDKDSELWKKSESRIPQAVTLQTYFDMNSSQKLSLNTAKGSDSVLRAEIAFPEDISPKFAYVKVALADSKTKVASKETREYIANVDPTKNSLDMIVFPVEKSSNTSYDGITVLQITPLC